MLAFAFVLASASLAADSRPPAPLEEVEAPAAQAPPAKPVARRPAQSMLEAVQAEPDTTMPPATPVDGTVIAGSALGGVAGIVGTAGLGTVLVLLANSAGASDASNIAFYGMVLALPVGAGIGAGIAHNLVHDEGALGSALAGVIGTLGGAAVGAGVGYCAVGVTGAGNGPYGGFAFAGGALIGAGVGALVGAGVGPAVHAALE